MAASQTKKSEPAIVSVSGDYHVNSRVALSLARVRLDDEDDVLLSKTRLWIGKRFDQYCEELDRLKRKLKWPTYVVANGDLVDDNYHPTHQIITTNKADIIKHAAEALDPLFSIGDFLVVTRGTPAHVGLGAELEELLAMNWNHTIQSSSNRFTWRWWTPKLGGVTMSIKHHPGSSTRVPHTVGNAARSVALKVQDSYVRHRRWPPMLAIRSHNHKPEDSYDNLPVRALIIPSWQASTEYVDKLGAEGQLPVGGIIIKCQDGEYEIAKHYYDWPIETWWTQNG